jgi:protein involved in polysaccharide export with SLBB domain
LKYNIVIRPKDVIVAQNLPVGVYYMGGHVNRGGAFSLTGQKVTLREAVIAAGMFDQLAIPARTDIIRRIRSGTREGGDRQVFVRVDLDRIFTGQAPDIYLKPDDNVMVGTNALAPFIAAARGAFRLTYGFGFIYDRNFAIDEEQQFR